jgi:hypothetical protein
MTCDWKSFFSGGLKYGVGDSAFNGFGESVNKCNKG